MSARDNPSLPEQIKAEVKRRRELLREMVGRRCIHCGEFITKETERKMDNSEISCGDCLWSNGGLSYWGD